MATSGLLDTLASEASRLGLTSAMEEEKPSTPPPDDGPPDAPEWTFQFSHTDRRGRVFAGTFTHKILTEEQKLRATVIRAKLMGGQPISAFDQDTIDYLDYVTSLQMALVKRPPWANDLLSFDSKEVVYALWSKCALHIARWFRLDIDPAESEGTKQENA